MVENIFKATIGFEDKVSNDYEIHDVFSSNFSNKEFFRFFYSARPESITPCELMGEILYSYRVREREFIVFISSKAYRELKTSNSSYVLNDETVGYFILYGDKVHIYDDSKCKSVEDPYSIIVIRKISK
jgi:hypothetical protein